MKTVQMTLDESLVATVDKLARKLNTTRSAFTREALRSAIQQHKVSELEQRHRRGYQVHPVHKGEFRVWEAEQAWGDE